MELMLNQKDFSFTNTISDTAIKGRDIVIISLQPWYYEIGSNCKNIAIFLSEHNRVLYVNLPINRKTYLSKNKNKGIQQHCFLIKQGGKNLIPIRNNMWEFYPDSIVESINWLPSTTAFKAVNYINNRRFSNNIKQAIECLNFKDVILFNDNDIYNGFYLKELLSPSLYIYYCRDFLQGYDYWKKHCSVMEPQLIKKADVVLANSTYYAEYCSAYNLSSYYVGQGCDFNLFDNTKHYSLPKDVRSIQFPTIGYVGALDSARLDIKIIELIASENPNWNIVLVGPEDETFIKSTLHQKTNIHFLGKKPLSQLPNYIQAFDVCINPQLKNKITTGNYPLKIDEYLSMGKPVVATRTKAMKLFETYTYLANEAEEYSSLIKKALAENNRQLQTNRIAFAKTHTWENSMNELNKAVSKNLVH